jgi:hypothetical protein
MPLNPGDRFGDVAVVAVPLSLHHVAALIFPWSGARRGETRVRPGQERD